MQKNILSTVLLLVMILGLTNCASNNPSPKANPREYQVGAYLWQQHSGEYKALTYQAYNWAQKLVQIDLQDKHNRKRAVVFDIDETILDNSTGGAREIKNNLPWKESLFSDWVKLREAVAIPGALNFVKFLEKERVSIFYVTNRKQEMFQDTYENLVKVGFPVDKDKLLMMGLEKSKEPRRQEILKNYDIILLLGDNLADFHKAFDVKGNAQRNLAVEEMKSLFGEKFIVLPNPLYGDWEKEFPYDKSKMEFLKLTP